jgi:hypothetical protein
MINPLSEQVMPLSVLRRHLPGKPHYQTLLEWCKLGRKNQNTGLRVRLERVQLPSGQASSLEAYLRFIERLNAAR